jgi:hypothetical protein
MGMPLTIAVQLLPTPDASLGTRGGKADPEKRRAGGHSITLEDVIRGGETVIGRPGEGTAGLLPTPLTTDYSGSRTQAAGNPSLEGALLGYRATEILKHGRRPTPIVSTGVPTDPPSSDGSESSDG